MDSDFHKAVDALSDPVAILLDYNQLDALETSCLATRSILELAARGVELPDWLGKRFSQHTEDERTLNEQLLQQLDVLIDVIHEAKINHHGYRQTTRKLKEMKHDRPDPLE